MSLAEAFEAAGLKQRDIALKQAIALFLNHGGTIERLREIVEETAERMRGEDQCRLANHGQRTRVRPAQPVEEEAICDRVSKDHVSDVASSSPSREPITDGVPLHGQLANVASREPSPAQRAAASIVAKTIALTVLDSFKVDGLAIGDWTVAEARVAGRRKSREGYILIEAARHVANANGDEKLRQIIKPLEMERIIQRAAEVADAV